MAVPTLTVDVAFTTDPGTDPPVWTSLLEADVRSVNIRRGKSSELEQVGAGTATIVLNNRLRKFDPTYTSSPYYPNLTPMKRVRVKATYKGATEELFNGFVESYEQQYPSGVDQTTVMTCVDAFKVLALANVPVSPDHPEVIESTFSPLWGYWSLGDKPGVKVSPGGFVRVRDNKDKGKKPQRKWRRARKQLTVSGNVGPEGIAVNTPTFEIDGGGATPIVAGTLNKGIQFTRASSEFLKFPVADNDDLPGSGNNIAYSVVARPTSLSLNTQIYIAGPLTTGNLVPWQLGAINSGGSLHFFSSLQFSDATSNTITEAVLTLATDTFYQLTATWNGTTDEHQLFLGTALIASSTNAGKTIRTGVTPGHVYIGGHKAFTDATGTGRYSDVVVAHAVVSERAFSNDSGGFLGELTALETSWVDAGMGFAAFVQTSGDRIENTLAYLGTSNPLYADRNLDPGTIDVLPQRWDGATALDLMRDVETTEDGFFFIAKDGVATFYDFDWRAGGGSGILGSFGNMEHPVGGGLFPMLPYADVKIARDDAFIFNTVAVTREDGITQENTNAGSVADFLGRRLEISDTLHVSDTDADTLSSRLLLRYKDPAERVYEMTILGGAGDTVVQVDEVWGQIMERDLFEVVTVHKHNRTTGAVELQANVRVIGIEIDIDPYRNWRARWALMPLTY